MLIRNLYAFRNADNSIYENELSMRTRNGLFHLIQDALRQNYTDNRAPEARVYIKQFCKYHYRKYFSESQRNIYAVENDYISHEALLQDIRSFITNGQEKWIFSFIEFLIQCLHDDNWHDRALLLLNSINQVFEQEMVAFQILDDQVVNRSDQYLHQEVVEGAVIYLKAVGFDRLSRISWMHLRRRLRGIMKMQ